MIVPVLGESTNAQLRSDFTIEIDGEECNFTRSDGSVASPILYNDTTYLPLRAIGEIMGKNVNWDKDNKVISLSGKREETTKKDTNAVAAPKEINVEERDDFKIVIEGVENKFTTVNGAKIIVYNGSAYLSLESISQIMRKDIAWDSEKKKVSLTLTDSYIGDTKSFEIDSISLEMVNKNDVDIGIEKAKEIALTHAELKEKQVSFLTEKEDGAKK